MLVSLAAILLTSGCGEANDTVSPAATVTTTVTQTIEPTASDATVTLAEEPSEVTVTETATVTVTEGADVSEEDAVSSGVWTVGRDIEPGSYRPIEPVSEDCYWAVLVSGSNGADIVDNGIPGGGYPTVTVREGQDLELARCGTWALEDQR
ncbi:hypothetical protein [Ornithinimicrobium sediminis]|uniref:hypothetical protein n=1 Tax=Ornithinimicrobium sediminis TaxID=2904603 RepID=UPI001E3E1E11|nr:hypothetical protein [Ornithinimicrobium sediminis]MCE0488291.1 hypothetical protein [Ornithinimicrobium sediminis]